MNLEGASAKKVVRMLLSEFSRRRSFAAVWCSCPLVAAQNSEMLRKHSDYRTAALECYGIRSPTKMARSQPRPSLHSTNKELPLAIGGRSLPRPNIFLSRDCTRSG